ncbi:hypothetical protein JNK13_10500 [bacterium]|nr:hypothetical protein [bacterium]
MLTPRPASNSAISLSGLIHSVHLPHEGTSTNTPLVLLVHGRAGNDRVMWTFSSTVKGLNPIVIAPQAPLSDPIGGFSWWPIDESIQDPEERMTKNHAQLNTALEKLEHFISTLPALYGIKTKNIIAMGFSQGAGIISTLSLKRPELFSGVALLAGFVPRVVVQRNAFVSTTTTPRPNYFIFHGTEDQMVPIKRAEQARDFLIGLGCAVEYHTDAVKHKVSASGIKALKCWVDGLLIS